MVRVVPTSPTTWGRCSLHVFDDVVHRAYRTFDTQHHGAPRVHRRCLASWQARVKSCARPFLARGPCSLSPFLSFGGPLEPFSVGGIGGSRGGCFTSCLVTEVPRPSNNQHKVNRHRATDTESPHRGHERHRLRVSRFFDLSLSECEPLSSVRHASNCADSYHPHVDGNDGALQQRSRGAVKWLPSSLDGSNWREHGRCVLSERGLSPCWRLLRRNPGFSLGVHTVEIARRRHYHAKSHNPPGHFVHQSRLPSTQESGDWNIRPRCVSLEPREGQLLCERREPFLGARHNFWLRCGHCVPSFP